mgnify:CR=1 FL=1
MGVVDEKDYIMRMIKEMVQVLFYFGIWEEISVSDSN